MNLLKYQYRLLTIVALVSIAYILTPPSPPQIPSSTIVDISWPNCKSTNHYEYSSGIVGVSGGLDFRNNSCAFNEAALIRKYGIYINTGYAGVPIVMTYRSTPKNCTNINQICLAYNWGYNATIAAITYASESNVHSQMWWLDVETDNSWSNHAAINKASLLGAVAAIRDKTILTTVGVYSSPVQWQTLTGSWHISLPTWVATGSKSERVAKNACTSKSFTDNTNWLIQYTTSLRRVYCFKLIISIK
jgi:hypothetical protein